VASSEEWFPLVEITHAKILESRITHNKCIPRYGTDMRTNHSFLDLVAVLVLCLPTAAIMPDDPDTPYDESETLPYEQASLPVSSFGPFQESAAEPQPRSGIISDGRSFIGLLPGFRVHRERQGQIIHTSLIILDRSLRC
jgi:hypothetical protein